MTVPIIRSLHGNFVTLVFWHTGEIIVDHLNGELNISEVYKICDFQQIFPYTLKRYMIGYVVINIISTQYIVCNPSNGIFFR